MNHETNMAQGPVDVNVRPAAWAIKQRDYDDDRDDPWAGIYCNPDTAREDADALEATSTDRFDVVPVYELTDEQRNVLLPAKPNKPQAKNVFAFPATTTMTPEQALLSALEFAKNDNMQDVLVVGYDGDGYLWCGRRGWTAKRRFGCLSNCGSTHLAMVPNAALRGGKAVPLENTVMQQEY